MAETKARKDIELLKYKRDALFQRIDVLYIKAQTLSIDASPEDISEFKVRCEKLNGHYEGFERYQADLVKCYVQLKELEELDNIQAKNKELDTKYFYILSAKTKLLPSEVKHEPTEATQNSSLSAKLPKINLPIFEGPLKQWPNFKDLFIALVHSNSTISDIEKFHFLISCTRGEPNNLVRSLPLIATNYDVAWTQLNDRYDNKRLLACQYVEEILSASVIKYESPKLLRNLLDLVSENTSALKSMEIPEDLGNFIILHLILKKLDKHTRQLFERKFSSQEYPKLNELLDFLREHCKSLEAAQSCPRDPDPTVWKKPNVKSDKMSNFTNKSFFTETETKKCLYCSENHSTHSCPAYLNLTPAARRDFIKSKEACFNCLSPSHMQSKCKSSYSCRKCRRLHHTSLHEDRTQNTSTNTGNSPPVGLPKSSVQTPDQSSNVNSPPSNVAHSLNANSVTRPNSTTLLGTALIQVKDITGSFYSVRALIDPGSQSSFVTESTVKKLCLPRFKCNQNILGLSETAVSPAKGVVNCILKPRQSEEPKIQVNAVILNKITSSLPSVPISNDIIKYFKDFSLADPNFHSPSQIDFLIGADLFPTICDGGRHTSPIGYPTAFSTVFGWILIGSAQVQDIHDSSLHTSVTNLAVAQPPLEVTLKRFWETEEPIKPRLSSPEDIICDQIFHDTHSRTPSGRYMVKLPFKENSGELGNSYDQAKQCLLSLERRFPKNENFKSAYVDFMKEYELLGHMTRQNSTSTDPPPKYFIPHHGIFKSSASGSKLRVVFNASAPSSTGLSLNDKLLVGEKLQNEVSEILSRFRLHSFVITADICKMYRQILIHPEHRPFQTILWREDPTLPISMFSLNTVSYGVNSAPYLALKTLKQLVLDEGANYPLAKEAILNDMFVDDCLTGCDSLDEAKQMKSELIEILQKGGFQLSKWASNSVELLEDVSQSKKDLLFSDENDKDSIKVLGLKWRSVQDTFSYEVPPNNVTYTKRGILSHVSKIFDPLGLLSPVVFWAKCLMQKLWTLGLEWDQPLPPELSNQAKEFFETLSLLNQLNINRQVLPKEFIRAEIHCFADASNLGYGCSIYLRVVQLDGSISTNLILGKSKVAPLKPLTIPKLELCGALLLTKALKFCIKALAPKLTQLPVFAWTDSTVVLHWIRTPPHLLRTFVANRVADIQSTIDPSRWNHAPTSSNPADHASRGLSPRQILQCPLWWNGPDWLQEEEHNWPSLHLPDQPPTDSLPELRPAVLTVNVSQETNLLFPLENYSKFIPLQNCVGWILRFINNCQPSKPTVKTSFLSTEERKSALHVLIKITQKQYFDDYFKSTSKGSSCPTRLLQLAPFIDSQGLIRVGGRLKNAPISYDHKHPLLLPKNSHLTGLLIDYFHIKFLHVGPRSLQAIISQQFWIISARSAIRKRLTKCLTCFRFKATAPQPFMANLPEDRLTANRPFLKVGVDFGGYFSTKSDKLRKPQILKSYICLFVCFSTKAVHLEMVSSLSTEAFLAALSRFVARRGLCSDIYSDQGTNFVGASRELNEMVTWLSQHSSSICPNLAEKGINWHFIPPSSPHFGGLWESGIKSTKYHIKRVIGDQILTFEEFSTVLAQIEAILNSRPLCSSSTDPHELDPLTPGHFLIGQPLTSLPHPDLTTVPINRLSRWQLVQQASTNFWKKWNLEYLHQLQQRRKWFKSVPNLKKDDLVLVKENNLPPTCWLTGRIVDTHQGSDGIVRVATLKTKQGLIKRPVVKLCPLPDN